MKNVYLYKTGFLLSICLVLFVCSNAQEFTVKGTLVDSATSKPVTDATINFLQPQTKVSKTVVADKNGAYQSSLLPGSYRVTISHTGFRKKTMQLSVQEMPVDMGNIRLTTVAKTLSEVTVVATRPLVEQKDDRLIYNVEEDPAAKSESVSDILRKTPFVNVDGDGAIQVNGQSNFKVLLDGREMALFSQNVKEALKAFPGATVARIEVITSPSAKYDAEGVGGIINIITKSKVAGYNGSLNANMNSTGHKMTGMNINLKKGRVGITASYNIMGTDNLRSHQLAITSVNQPGAFVRREVGGDREADMFFNSANLEIGYDIDSTNTVVVYGNLTRMRNKQFNDYTTYTLFPNGNADTDPYYLESRMAIPTHSFGTDFIRKYKGKPQKELTFRFQAMYNTHRLFNNSQQTIGSVERFLVNKSEAFNSEYTAQVDFVEPLNKTTRLETGFKSILREASSDFESQVKFSESDPYKLDPTNSNKFSYDQDVYSGYVSVNKTFKAFTTRLGLRVEHTRVDGDFISTGTVVQQRYTNFIPNVLFTKQFSKIMNSNFTYGVRIGRPNINSLNPFVNNSDSLFISHGNPELGPQIVHNFAWQMRFFKGSKFISFQTGYNFSNNLIIQNPTFDVSKGITSVSPANAGQLREFTLGFTSNLPVKKWNLALNATGRFARLRNSLQTPWSNTVAGQVNSNISYKPSPKITITSNGGYFVPLRMPNSTFPDNYFYGFNFAYKVFKQKLTITASAANFLSENRKMRFKTENDFFITENINTVIFRNIGLSLNYNFGRLKESVSKKKGVTNDDQVQ